MGRFPWNNGHSKQGSDKMHTVTHDFFSKDTAEPSRQALNELIKDHSSLESPTSDGSPTYRGRSRTNTVNSSFSLYARSVSDASNEMMSRPSSQQSFADVVLPLADRQEHSTKSLLSRGTRMLKRQGSKLSLLPSPSQDSFTRSDTRSPELPPTFKIQRQSTINLKRPVLKKSISTPFAFQHLTHADQGQFQSIDTVTKTQLASDFDCIQAEQQAEDSVRGIPLADLRAVLPGVEVDTVEPTSPTTDAIPLLPTTPPRPQPPPKDGLMSPYSPSDFRMSRSMENFSRPTRLSVTASDVSPPSRSEVRLSAFSPITRTSVLGKPLPLLPDVVHAVSTIDDIALPLPTAPLPSPPKVLEGVLEEEERPVDCLSSSPLLAATPRSSRAQVKASPSPRHKRRSQSSGEVQFNAAFNNVMLMMKAQSQPRATASPDTKVRTAKKRISIGVKPIEIEDWEDAIDYSWDHATDLEEVTEEPSSDSTIASQTNAPTSLGENYLIVEQGTVEETSSSASTPLMMQAYPNTTRQSSHTSLASSLSKSDEEPSSPLLGLGIASLPPVPTVSLTANDPVDASVGDAGRFDPLESFSPTMSRTPNSTMSKSSSQESIILSIASSVIGTQRSSNSSTSLSDFAHLANFGDSMEKLDLRGSTSSIETRNRDGSQDTIREGSQSSPTIGTMPVHSDICDIPGKKHDRVASASQITIPERKSSIPGTEGSKIPGGRRRANTANSRPRRNTRVSYSLFPSAGPS
ncbi:uncharacterized protein A1O9_03143 [Exophiala aquamarina CBS 119918]|uniref:CRIB domain-containing protein n=1 Tax=Exophiala aquamarina CBS 119918 TaxID=1182545 RepID=A0A072Q0Z3_9EURO|nr:uncharacterized protein A1O9_03143 [Exophiala aquamarina CBS 119918]KEF61575.1 hypothetical protein A1O9_03143 [Exophiala aquamarina CBS 119918]